MSDFWQTNPCESKLWGRRYVCRDKILLAIVVLAYREKVGRIQTTDCATVKLISNSIVLEVLLPQLTEPTTYARH